jgi:hypothetical protein
VEKLNKLKFKNLEEYIALRILEKQITDLEDQIMLMDPSGMDEIAQQQWELVRSVIMQMARNRDETHLASIDGRNAS